MNHLLGLEEVLVGQGNDGAMVLLCHFILDGQRVPVGLHLLGDRVQQLLGVIDDLAVAFEQLGALCSVEAAGRQQLFGLVELGRQENPVVVLCREDVAPQVTEVV